MTLTRYKLAIASGTMEFPTLEAAEAYKAEFGGGDIIAVEYQIDGE
jgi:hypothetical protein